MAGGRRSAEKLETLGDRGSTEELIEREKGQILDGLASRETAR
jgi:hypothetical protein